MSGTLGTPFAVRSVGIACAYFVLGKLGLALALPPGFVSAIWPAAGMAFAVTALWGGRQTCLGLFLGSMLTNATVGGHFNLDSVACLIAAGSTLQAVLGGMWLMHVVPSLNLDGPHRIIRFTLVGMGSSLIAATIGNLTLYLHGFIVAAQIPQSFLTWWLGDAFGVQIFTPLTLLVLAPNVSWKNRRLTVGLPLLLAFLLFSLGYSFVRDAEERQLMRSFSATIEPVEMEMASLNHIYVQAMGQLAAGYNLRRELPGPEFQKLAAGLQTALPALRGIVWVPLPAQSAGADKAVPGDALLKDTPLATVAQGALDSHSVRTTRLQPQSPPSAGPGGILLVAPVQSPTGRGVITGMLDLGVIDQELARIPGIAWELREVLADGERLVWQSRQLAIPAFATHTAIDRQGVYSQRRVVLADREWQFRFYLPHAKLVGETGNTSLLVIILALFACSILASFSLVTSGNRERVESEVREKTAALSAEIAERKRQEVALEQARAVAESATLAKSQFLAAMSHEIRTPMNAILGMHALLLRTSLTTKQEDYAKKSESSARSLLSLLNDILDFSKVEAGKMTLDPSPFAIDTLLGELATILNAYAADKHLQLQFELAPDTPKVVLVDGLRLKQVLVNLGGNAIKFTQAGSVLVRVKPVWQRGGRARLSFSVQDTGIGIALEHQQHIFDGFTQAEASTSRRFGGTGLGLAISKKLVELMGGRLELQSQAGVGSTFGFAIDCPVLAPPGWRADVATGLQQAGAQPVLRLAGMRLLVVEDNPVNQQIAEELLASEGAHITLAGNGQLGVEAVAAAQPQFDAVLMDVQMPVMDGYAATQAIRTELGLLDLPIIAMTANAMASDIQASQAAGMTRHISKPFELTTLVNTLLELSPFVPRAHTVPMPQRPAPMALDPAQASALALGHLDVPAALQRFGGNVQAYLRALRTFAAQTPALRQTIGFPATAGHTAEALRACHTIKGLAATLGADALSRLAAALESGLQASAAVEASLLRRFDAEMEVVLMQMNSLLAGVPALATIALVAPDGGPPSPEQMEKLYESLLRLHTQLAKGDMDALELHSQLTQEFAGLLGEHSAPLEAAMANLDFELAQAECQQLLLQARASGQSPVVSV